jgi:hypothetical protein
MKILKKILKNYFGLDLTDSEQRQAAGSCEQDNESLRGEFLDSLTEYRQFLDCGVQRCNEG